MRQHTVRLRAVFRFDALLFERQQHRLTVLRAQSVDTARVYGTHQILVYLVLGILAVVDRVREAQSDFG